MPRPARRQLALRRAILATSCVYVTSCSSPNRVPSWYETLSHRPGPEVTDAAMRRRILASGHPWKVRDRATGIEMVLILPGEFWMGSPETETGREAVEGPQHRVRLTKAFYIGATEVTQAQWRHVMGSAQGFFQGDDKPADGSWDDLQEFLAKANHGLPPTIHPLRAPTEAEWEYACRAGTTGPHSFDGPPSHDLLQFNDGTPKSGRVVDREIVVEWLTPPSPGYRPATVPAGSLPPNPWGLHEMHGNLWEWTADRYATNSYEGRGALTIDPFDPPTGDESHALRSGDWYKSAHRSRSASRGQGGPHTRSNRIGFRVARTL